MGMAHERCPFRNSSAMKNFDPFVHSHGGRKQSERRTDPRQLGSLQSQHGTFDRQIDTRINIAFNSPTYFLVVCRHQSIPPLARQNFD